MRSLRSRWRTFALGSALIMIGLNSGNNARADHTPAPTTVTLSGSLQNELGCPGDWAPDCMNTALTYDSVSDTWVGNFLIPAGSYKYKVAINGKWNENYGSGGVQDGPDVPLVVTSEQNVTFVYDHDTQVATHSVSPIVTALVLQPVRPNPAVGGRLLVQFTLPMRHQGRIDVIDVAGRVVVTRSVGHLGPGPHTMQFGDARLRSGVYLIRVTQFGRSAATRVAVLN